jgi:hypothetical protein
MRGDGIFIIEDPEECGYLDPPEALLRLFPSSAQAREYMETKEPTGEGLKVRSTDLMTIWNLLGQIDSLSQKQFDAPIRIEMCSIVDDELRTIKTYRTAHGPRS